MISDKKALSKNININTWNELENAISCIYKLSENIEDCISGTPNITEICKNLANIEIKIQEIKLFYNLSEIEIYNEKKQIIDNIKMNLR